MQINCYIPVAGFGLALWGSGVDSSVDSYSGAGFALRGPLTHIKTPV